ncbi:MAG: PspA/IM30 family protein [Actinomycetales bacterium]|nr:MAG: PspA/IM30 family protein [Actinomycetales bacterium]
MGMGQRVRQIFRSRRAGGVDDLKTSLDETYRKHLATLQQVRRGVADVTTSRKRVEVRLAQLRQQAADVDVQARSAVERGDDDAARAALTRKLTLEEGVTGLQQQHAQLQAEEARLVGAATDLEGRIEDFRIRKDTLTARHTAATARVELNDAGSGISSDLSEVNQRMSEAERHTRELEAQADAVDELASEGIIRRAGESAEDAEARRFDALLADGSMDDKTLPPTDGDHDGPQQISP